MHDNIKYKKLKYKNKGLIPNITAKNYDEHDEERNVLINTYKNRKAVGIVTVVES